MRRLLPAVLLALASSAAFLAVFPDWADAATVRRALGDGSVASLTDQQQIFLEAKPAPGEGLLAFARRMTGSSGTAREIASANGRPRRLLAEVRYRVPYALLRDDLKLRAVRALFPDDEALAAGWRHTVPRRSRGASLWRVAEWFTGAGENFGALRRHNDLADETIHPGQSLVIPEALLLAPFRAALPEPTVAALEPPPTGTTAANGAEPSEPAPARPAAVADGGPVAHLDYTGAGDERFAVYRLKRGEALYSAVVVRFTGRVIADDVNELAAELATLNGIRDVTDMPVGQRVRIPLDLLLPEYLPLDDPRRIEWETNRTESAKYSNPVRARRLEGITIVLDAGHGGDDPGVDHKGTWESTYVYDVTLRVKRLLERATAAEVRMTTRDGDGYTITERDALPGSRRHAVLTDPPYRIANARVAANLRWYLSNSIHREATKRSGDEDKTLFLSVHADSLHPSLRGAMVYVPATSLTSGEYGKSGQVYHARAEVREQPRVSFSWKQRTRSEGLSRQLAGHLIASFRSRGLAVHREKPIRDRIIRCRRCRPFVPAVIRRNAVPTKVLLEICNMNNAEDRRLLRTRAFREQVATAIVDGILGYYGQDPLGTSSTLVAAGR
ncbi:MAG: N-acetylmuramoyl-L-alanine amidase [Acidobacteriota bacterium]